MITVIMRMTLCYTTCQYDIKIAIMVFVYITHAVTITLVKTYSPSKLQSHMSNKDRQAAAVLTCRCLTSISNKESIESMCKHKIRIWS